MAHSKKNGQWLYALFLVFTRPLYAFLTVVVALAIFFASIALPIRLQLSFFLPLQPTFWSKPYFFLVYPFKALPLNFTGSAIVTTATIALLFGISTGLLVYYFRSRAALYRGTGVSMVGMMSGLLGIGCTACGSVLLSSFLGFSATTAFLGWLPLRGLEFSLLAIFMLLLSIYLVSKKIANPANCKIKISHSFFYNR